MPLKPAHTKIILVIVLLAAQFLAPRPLHACSCIEYPPAFDSVFGESSAVFSGRVTAVSGGRRSLLFDNRVVEFLMPKLAVRLQMRAFFRQVTFDVHQSWKGVGERQVTVWTGRGGGDCGYHFAAGDAYLVYAYEGDSILWTNICTRTAPLTAPWAKEDLARLGSLPNLPLSDAPSSVTLGVYIAVALGSLILIVVGYYMRLHKKEGSLV